MNWVRRSTPASASVLVMTGRPWFGEGPAEWFPVLAQRRSVATIQGDEWLSGHPTFRQRQQQVDFLQGCRFVDGTCVINGRADFGMSFAYVYIQTPPSSDCCGIILENLLHDGRFAEVYRAPGAAIFRILPSADP
jgi:hypothetical protein